MAERSVVGEPCCSAISTERAPLGQGGVEWAPTARAVRRHNPWTNHVRQVRPASGVARFQGYAQDDRPVVSGDDPFSAQVADLVARTGLPWCPRAVGEGVDIGLA